MKKHFTPLLALLFFCQHISAQAPLRLSIFNSTTATYTDIGVVPGVDSIFGIQQQGIYPAARAAAAPEKGWYIFIGKGSHTPFKLYTVSTTNGSIVYSAPASFVNASGTASSFKEFYYSDTLGKLVGIYTDSTNTNYFASCDLQTGAISSILRLKSGNRQRASYNHTDERYYLASYSDTLLYIINPATGHLDSLDMPMRDTVSNYFFSKIHDLQYDDLHHELYCFSFRTNPFTLALIAKINLQTGYFRKACFPVINWLGVNYTNLPFYHYTLDAANGQYLFNLGPQSKLYLADVVNDTSISYYTSGDSNTIIPQGDILTNFEYDYLSGHIYAIHKALVPLPPAQRICMVTVDSASTHNVIVWEKLNKEATDTFNIYREITTNQYSLIAAVPGDSLSEYHDYAANPNSTAYRYKISTIDTNHTEGALSPFHNTIHLQYLSSGNLIWNQYTGGDSAVGSYDVYCDPLANDNWQLMLSMPGTQTTATDVNFASHTNAHYRLLANFPYTCTPSRSSFPLIISNIIAQQISGIDEASATQNIQLYPVPATNELNISGPQSAELLIFSAEGKLVLSVKNPLNNRIDISLLPNGFYTAEIKTNNYSLRRRWVKL